MFRSLRFQLPALFLLGVVVAGLVSAAIALRLFRTYAQNRAQAQAYGELARETTGLTKLYAKRAGFQRLSAGDLELATGDNIFYKGIDLFPGQGPTFKKLPRGVDVPRIPKRKQFARFTFRAASGKTLLAVARPVTLGRQTFGTIVVAKPSTRLHQRWLALIERLLLAFAGGGAGAGGVAWDLSRRATKPGLGVSPAPRWIARGPHDG